MFRKFIWIFSCLFVLLALFTGACIPTEAISAVNNNLVAASSPASPTISPALKPSQTATASITATPFAATLPSAAPATPTKPATCTAQAGSLDKGLIATQLLAQPMRYIVYLPPCYNSDSLKRYPVLYLLHGQNSTEEQWIRIGAVSTADRLISSGKTPPFIMVFPYDYSYQLPTEYKFEDVFLQELLPRIAGSYRILPGTRNCAIGGVSRGGAWALHIGIRHPDLFGAIGGHSPSIFYTDENTLPGLLLAIPTNQMPRIWLDAGDRDSELELILPFEDFLADNGVLHEWHQYVGAHDELNWSAHVDQYLSWYAQVWR
jgi:enterochelin esterase-like enzyme